mmetsp:Transcript_41945/g.45537  ORF Transcript_41945/g.45537 Transcript_41945/m.45537 type:complete len:127 (+) Transcript_41945:412-792(+)
MTNDHFYRITVSTQWVGIDACLIVLFICSSYCIIIDSSTYYNRTKTIAMCSRLSPLSHRKRKPTFNKWNHHQNQHSVFIRTKIFLGATRSATVEWFGDDGNFIVKLDRTDYFAWRDQADIPIQHTK